LKITFIAGESFGTRSMATYIETKDANILIDPGVALAPRRFGLPPHPIELDKQKEHWNNIVEYGKKADIMVITHYHYDHHNPRQDISTMFSDKIVLCKDPTENINYSQSRRGIYFIEKINKYVRKTEYADGKTFRFGDTYLVFSAPLPHGEDTRLGYVLGVYIYDGENSFLFSSDVEGIPLKEQLDFIHSQNPQLLYIDGPLTYMLGSKYNKDILHMSISNLLRLTDMDNLEVFILDHHLIRDAEWLSWVLEVYEAARYNGIWIGTAAEFMGKKPKLLEAYRRELYRER